MDSRNIAICLAPTLLNMNSLKEISTSAYNSLTASPTGISLPSSLLKDSTQLMSRQCNASLECLTLMIEMPKKIFLVPNEAYTKCQFTKSELAVPLTLNEQLGSASHSMLSIYFSDRIEKMIKELKEKPRNWSRLRTDCCVEISYKIVEDDDFPLRLWKLTIELEGSAAQILNKLLRHRAQWDEDLLESRVVEALASQTEIFQYAVHVMPPQPSRDFCELR